MKAGRPTVFYSNFLEVQLKRGASVSDHTYPDLSISAACGLQLGGYHISRVQGYRFRAIGFGGLVFRERGPSFLDSESYVVSQSESVCHVGHTGCQVRAVCLQREVEDPSQFGACVHQTI